MKILSYSAFARVCKKKKKEANPNKQNVANKICKN